MEENMKKLLSILLLALLLACGKTDNQPTEDATNTPVVVQEVDKSTETEEPVETEEPAETEEPTVTEEPTTTENSTTPTNAVTSSIRDLSPEIIDRDLQEMAVFTRVIDVISNSNTKSIDVIFSKELAHDFDPTAYVKISPHVSGYTSSRVGNRIVIRGDFSLENEYDISILKGVRATDNSILEVDKNDKIIFNQLEPRIVFSNEGILLPSTSNKNVAFRSLNVNKVNISVTKVYHNNITQFLQNFSFQGNGNYITNSYYSEYDYDYVPGGDLRNVGDIVLSKEYNINNEKNTWVQSSIDLSGIIDDKGIYVVSIYFDSSGTSYVFDDEVEQWQRNRLFRNNANIIKTIIRSDIGMIAQADENVLAVKVMDILENEPKENINVKLMTLNNQIIDEKTTDAAGDVEFSIDSRAFYLICEEGENTSILKLTNPLSTNGFDIGGVYSTDGLRTFIYTERGVYRPGDNIYLSIIARNNNEPLPNDHPVGITVYTPRGSKYIENDIIKDGINGFYTYEFNTDVSDETGIWRLEATIGSQRVTKSISVETVVPYKIRANIVADEIVSVDEGPFKWSIESEYLFGAPASGLEYEVNIVRREERPHFLKYPNYTFTSRTQHDYYTNDFLSGDLDEEGKIVMTTTPELIEFRSLNLIMEINARVKEDSGRPVLTSEFLTLKKFDSYVGIEIPDYYIKTGEELGLRIITPSIDGERLVPGRSLIYRIYENSYSWWWDYNNHNEFIRSIKSNSHSTLLVEKEFVSTEEPYVIRDVINKYGHVFVEVEDMDSGQIANVYFYSSDWGDPTATTQIETLDVVTDKKTYNVGDKANFTFRGVDGAKALVAVEVNGQVKRRYLMDVTNGEITDTLEITEDMTPTAYVHVMLLQDYEQKENDRPLRLYGTAPIRIEDEKTKLNITIDAPESVMPNEKFTVKISNDKNRKIDYTIAVVDEGLLDITSFATPNPWTYFYQKRSSRFTQYDNYSEIMDKPYGRIHQILKVGGDDDATLAERRKRQRDVGFEDADRFVPVSMFKGVLTTDDNGNAEIEFEMPTYMGSVRIMVIGAVDNAYSSAEKEMLVKAPIVVQQDLPRTLKVGDRFSFPVNVFALEENIGEIEVSYSFRDRTQIQRITLEKNEKRTLYFTDAVDPIIGNDKITITAKSGVYNYEETVGIAINSNSVPITVSKEAILKEKEFAEFTQAEEYIKGSVDSYVIVSSTPKLGLDHRLRYLITYPYGCLEQTTSATFPQIFLDKVMTKKSYDKQRVLQNVNAGISRIISRFQLSNGSFSYWPGSGLPSEWASNYAGHFLIMARKNGYYVPEASFNNWLSYTDSIARESLTDDNRTSLKLYALYLVALTGNPNLSQMNYIHQHALVSLGSRDKMFLAAAYKLAGEDEIAKNIADSVDKYRMFNSSYYGDYGSSIREMAIYLDCYYTVHGKVDEEVYRTIVNRLKSNNWYSTQSVGYSLLALSNVITDNEDRAMSITVEIDGDSTVYEGQSEYQIDIPEEAQNIKVTSNDDGGNAYVSYYWEGSPINSTIEDYSDNIRVERYFYAENGTRLSQPDETFSGESFWMEVVVSGEGRNMYVENVAINQILPTGWEIENLRVTDTPYPNWINERKSSFDYEDIRDDRIMWFFTLNSGYDGSRTHRFFVKINTVTKGVFDFPGTKVEAMYDNDYKAFQKGFKVEVK